MSGGLMSGGLTFGGLMSGGLMSGGLMSGGLMSDGLMSDGLMSGGWMSRDYEPCSVRVLTFVCIVEYFAIERFHAFFICMAGGHRSINAPLPH